ncbi:MAG: hypothetical protein OHK0037_25750 [Elainellaceae cyanobacterium]
MGDRDCSRIGDRIGDSRGTAEGKGDRPACPQSQKQRANRKSKEYTHGEGMKDEG